MEITKFDNSGLALIKNKIFGDNRGFFTERIRIDFLEKNNLPTEFVQENFSRSEPNVLRGLHYQFDKPQGKLITCLRGKIFDVALDIRKESETYGKHWTVELDGSRPEWFWIPAGFAHGFCTLGNEQVDLLYKVTEYYNPNGEDGILWSDNSLNINWPIQNPKLSPKDINLQSFAKYKENPKF